MILIGPFSPTEPGNAAIDKLLVEKPVPHAPVKAPTRFLVRRLGRPHPEETPSRACAGICVPGLSCLPAIVAVVRRLRWRLIPIVMMIVPMGLLQIVLLRRLDHGGVAPANG